MAEQQFLIYSNHHQMWWGADGRGYRSHILDAGRYALADTAQWLGRGCGCCLVPEMLVPVPPVEVFADPERLAAYAVNARRVATRKAKREGKTNRWAKSSTRKGDA